MEPTERTSAGGVGLAAPAPGRSRWWYLAPLLLSIVGGVVAYFAIRRDDPRMARNCLVIGAAVLGACIAVQAVLLAAPMP